MRLLRLTQEQECSHVIEVMLIENVKSIPSQLELESLGDLNRFLQADIEVTVAGLPKVVHSWSTAVVEIETYLPARTRSRLKPANLG